MPGAHDPAAAANRAASLGMWLSIGAFVLCCGPVGIVGIIFGARSMSLAKRAGVATPTRAVVSLVLGGLSVVLFTLVCIGTYRDSKKADQQEATVTSRIGSRRESAQIDKALACDLVQEQLLAEGGPDVIRTSIKDVTCDALDAKADRARISVSVTDSTGKKTTPLNACLGHDKRWFVWNLNKGGACANIPVPSVNSSADEKKARDGYEAAAKKAALEGMTATLNKILDDANAGKPTHKACDPAVVASVANAKLLTMDAAVLSPSKAIDKDTKWTFMTSSSVRNTLDPSTFDRAAAALEVRQSGSHIVVFRAVKRDWPSAKMVGSKKDRVDLDEGVFLGFISLYSLDTGAYACGGPLAFENADHLSYSHAASSDGRKELEDAAEDDLKTKFKTTSQEKLNELAPKATIDFPMFL